MFFRSQDFASFEDAVRLQHEEMDRQVAPFRPHLPRWAVPDEVRDKWPALHSGDSDEVNAKNVGARPPNLSVSISV